MACAGHSRRFYFRSLPSSLRKNIEVIESKCGDIEGRNGPSVCNFACKMQCTLLSVCLVASLIFSRDERSALRGSIMVFLMHLTASKGTFSKAV